MKLLLFDWNLGGHHIHYLRHAAQTFSQFASVTVAAPDVVLDQLSDLRVTTYALGPGRHAVNLSEPLGRQNARLAAAELDLMEEVTGRLRPAHVLNLYGDPIIRWLVQRRPFPSPVSLCLFFVRDHYRALYGNRFSTKETVRAQFLRWNIQRWRARPDAHALFFLDRQAVAHYRRRAGVAVHWMPEPPVASFSRPAGAHPRAGLAIYGTLAQRKGIDLVATAVSDHAPRCHLKLAGSVDPQFANELDTHVKRMREAGASVDLSPTYHDELSGLNLLAGSLGTVLAYPRHYGMSRVLLEASSVGTPAIVNDFGLLGYLVRKHNLGIAVDCRNAQTLGDALDNVSSNRNLHETLAGNLHRFAQQYITPVFQAAISAPFFHRPVEVSVGETAPVF